MTSARDTAPSLHHLLGSSTAKTTTTRAGHVSLCTECGWTGPGYQDCTNASEAARCHEEDQHPGSGHG